MSHKVRYNEWDAYSKLQWTALRIDSNQDTIVTVAVSNPKVPLPSGLTITSSFLNMVEGELILNELDTCDSWMWEGFEQRRRVQRYPIADGLPQILQKLVEKLVHT